MDMFQGGPRLALRRRKPVIALASIALALSGLGIESASASTRSTIAVSWNPDRSNAVRLDGSTVEGNIYVFVRNSPTLDKVDFYLDSPRRTNPPVRTDTDPPFDFVSTAADGTALPYDTTKLADGSHTIRAVLTWSDGRTSSGRGNFTVANKGVTATTAPSPTITTAAPTATTPAPTTTTAAPTAPATTTAAPTTTATAASTTSYPTTPPARICGNSILDQGPPTPPPGAIVVPAGDNSNLTPDWVSNGFSTPNKIFWFAPGVHTLGPDKYSQIGPGNNSTYIGAPGAIIDGQHLNNYSFAGNSENVTIKYLTIRNFMAPVDEGVTNHNSGAGWTMEYLNVHDNGGAGVFLGRNNTLRYSCLKDNSQYGFQALGPGDGSDPTVILVDHNEIAHNNVGDWEHHDFGGGQIGCGCTGGSKFWLSSDVTVTNNWIHDNLSVGLWFDNNNRRAVVENNYIENNAAEAIFVEAGYDVRIRYNYFKRNAIITGREFAVGSDPFPIAAVYVSESGAPANYGLKSVPMQISNNYFDNNWSGVALWENADRYSGSGAHTHISGTIKMGDLHTDDACKSGTPNIIPSSVGDKFKCRWSTENVIVENNVFRIDKSAIGANCAGANYCGINGIFSNTGCTDCGFDPAFGGYVIPWRITFQQGNIFRNNTYRGDWHFAGFQTTQPDDSRVTWQNWTAPAPAVPATFNHDNRPAAFGQDHGSTFTITP
jgi:Right handed beta helix region